MKRPLCVFTIVFVAVCWLVQQGTLAFGLVGGGLLLAGCLAFARWLRPEEKGLLPLMLCAMVTAGVLSGAYLHWNYQNSQYFVDKTCDVVGTVWEMPYQNDNGTYVYEIKLERIADSTYRMEGDFLLRLYSSKDLGLTVLDGLSARVSVFSPNPPYFEGAMDSQQYDRAKGIYLSGYTEPELVLPLEGKAGPWWQMVWAIKRPLLQAMEALPQPYSGLLQGIVLGEKENLDQGVQEDFQNAGLSHVLAVSGMHLSILVGMIQMVCVALWGRGRLSAVLVIIVSLLYGGLAAFSPSVSRSVGMHLIMSGAVLLRREYDSFTALSASVLVLLLLDPFRVGDVGLQLSVASMVGILLFQQWWSKKKRKFSRPVEFLLSSCGVSLSALFATAPFVLYYFGKLSFASVLAGLLVVPFIPLVFVLGFGYCLLFLLGLAGDWAAAPLKLVMDYLMGMSHVLGNLPGLRAATQNQNLILFLFFLLALVCWLLYVRPDKKQWPALLGVSGGMLVLCLLLPSNYTLLGQGEAVFLDVGQGSCTIFQSPQGVVLGDCGSSTLDAGTRAVDYLSYRGISKVDGVVISHYHDDHMNGLETLCKEISVEKLYLPSWEGGEQKEALLRMAKSYGVDVEEIGQDQSCSVGGMELQLFVDHCDRAAVEADNANEQNMVTSITCGGVTTLLTGDMELEGEQRFAARYDVDCDILSVAHHGSDSSSYYAFLEEVSPRYGVISCQRDNSYGHPAIEVLHRLSGQTDTLLRTDLQGTIRLVLEDGAVRQYQWREETDT